MRGRIRGDMKTQSIKCDYCGGQAELTSSAEVYGGKYYGMIYLCRPCWAYVGCHPGTKNPLGRVANAELRDWKKRAHVAFDWLWKSGRMGRNEAYRYLSDKLDIAPEKCHIGMFDVEQCKIVVTTCGGVE